MNLTNEISNTHHIEFDLINLGCPELVANQIAGGASFAPLNPHVDHPFVYLAGPMRGYDDNNSPAFDAARNIALSKGYNVISPADIDRKAGPIDDPASAQAAYFIRDVWSLYFLRKLGATNGIFLLPHWYRSVGAGAEFFNSRWLGLRLFRHVRHEMEPVSTEALVKEFAWYWISAIGH